MYSIGFYDVANEMVSHTKDKLAIMSNIWIVFNVLMEYCCRTEYETILSKLTQQYKNQMDKKCENLQLEINSIKKNREELSNDLFRTRTQLDEATCELNKEKNLRASITVELQNAVNMHEKEVEMRLKFESKLNNLASIHRELESRFLVMGKEYHINTERMGGLFLELTTLRK